ncbi:MAG: tRNA (N6-isopentenyl adenosine(37)-C2)-methylthiotransferase MiaB [Sedimentisphaerales bacterium]|nr:tRNA (N6-isopentenyl adenosine(37)-C2)-methylthiotransferase MiaB [Sedimentisphaerales bacterium]
MKRPKAGNTHKAGDDSDKTSNYGYDTQMNKKFYIENMGCQMNKLDSELVISEMHRAGYQQTGDLADAGVIIYNTCSVRQHAEDKVISKIGQLTNRHKKGPAMVLAVIGCMAERLGEQLLNDYAQVDVVCGPGRIHGLVDMIQQAEQHKRCLKLNDPAELEELEELDGRRQRIDVARPFAAFVRIMRGCNNFCHYCIVPYVRGRERSRPLDHIVQECKRLADEGVLEITLLGQTVNSYRYEQNGRELGLADVLEAIHDIDGLQRIGFVTNYPRNFDRRILQAMADLPKVCEYLHIPAQSGSDRILKAMNRHYTAAEYLDLIAEARQTVPALTVAGDFIVGFCGETEDDFEATKELVRQVRYKNCFVFKYSPRPGTRADDRLADDISDEVKKRRNIELLELQNSISLRDNQQLVGQEFEILVEGLSKKPHLNTDQQEDQEAESDLDAQTQRSTADNSDAPSEKPQLVGRTKGDQIVVFNAPEQYIGKIVPVRIIKASALTLFGVSTQD